MFSTLLTEGTNMATIIAGNLVTGHGATSAYNFAEWFDGQQRMLVAGEDFTADVNSVRTYIWRKARKSKLKVSIRQTTHEGRPALLVQAFP